MTTPQSLEEGVAALAATLTDRDLDAAAAGAYGTEVRLLVLGEKARRVSSKPARTTAKASA